MTDILDKLYDLSADLRGLSEALTTVAYSVGEKNDNVLGHDIYSELIFLSRCAKRIEREIGSMITDE